MQLPLVGLFQIVHVYLKDKDYSIAPVLKISITACLGR